MKIIIPVFVGAIIGYITNWLAIKMLFRPHGEKKIFGIKLPFTPGLIPKEKKRIAKSVGDAVGTHILTPEAVKQVLSSNETNEQVNQWLCEKVNTLKNKEESISELIKGEDADKFNNLKYLVSVNITKFVLNELKQPEFNRGTINFIDDNIFDDFIELGIGQIRTRGVQYLDKILRSDDIRKIINKAVNNRVEELNSDNKSLKELLPNTVENDIKQLLNNNKVRIGNGVRNVFNDEIIHKKLKDSISLMVDKNISPMITIFISSNQISEKIMQIVEKYINDPKSTDDYIMLLSNGIDKLMNTQVSEIALNLKPFVKESDVDILSHKILSQISDEDINKIISIIENEIINSKDKLKVSVLDYLSGSIDKFINSDSFETELNAFVSNSINNLTNIPIHRILKDIDDNIIANLIALLRTAFNTFAENELPKIMELFNVSRIVENQINSFDVEYTEKLILELANKELKAITWLGALLGGIMGILSPLLQML